MRTTTSLLLLALVAIIAPGCTHMQLVESKPDGTRVNFGATSFLSNSTFKGLTVGGVTKTTSQSLRVTSGSTEPNPEAITASADGLGTLIGTAAGTTAKTLVGK